MAHLHKGPWQVFNSDWFKSHQSSLLSWLNGSWLKRKLSRHAFRIEAIEPITEIAPSHYVVKLNDTQRRADFRTHPKYAKRLYYSLIAYWWFLHFLDWAFLDRWVPQYSFGLDNLTVKSADGEGGATCDGYVARYVTAGTDFGNVRTGNGTSVSNTTTAGTCIRITSHSTDTDSYLTIRRAGFAFNTDALGAGATITDTTLSIYSTDTYHSNGFTTIDNSINVVSFTPSNPGTFATGDYKSGFGTTIFCAMSYADYVVSNGFKNFVMDAAGRSNVNKTGITVFGMRVGSDISGTGITWKAGSDQSIGVRWVDYTGTASDPYLSVDYTPAATTVYKPSAIIVG